MRPFPEIGLKITEARRKRQAKQRSKFIAHLAECGVVTDARIKARIPHKTLYHWRRRFPTFAKAWEEALDRATDVLEDEAHRRAYAGVSEPVFYKGRECGQVQKYSDTLLIFLLKGRRPARFRENHRIEHTGKDGGPLIPRPALDDLTHAELAALATQLAAAASPPDE